MSTGKYDFDFEGRVMLLVEDNMISLKLIYTMLSQVNVNAICANTGKEAIDFCRTDPRICMVLMDIELPGINGYEATRQILEFRPALPVIATTAYALRDVEMACMDAGCVAFVTKPVQFKRFFQLMQSFLD